MSGFLSHGDDTAAGLESRSTYPARRSTRRAEIPVLIARVPLDARVDRACFGAREEVRRTMSDGRFLAAAGAVCGSTGARETGAPVHRPGRRLGRTVGRDS